MDSDQQLESLLQTLSVQDKLIGRLQKKMSKLTKSSTLQDVNARLQKQLQAKDEQIRELQAQNKTLDLDLDLAKVAGHEDFEHELKQVMAKLGLRTEAKGGLAKGSCARVLQGLKDELAEKKAEVVLLDDAAEELRLVRDRATEKTALAEWEELRLRGLLYDESRDQRQQLQEKAELEKRVRGLEKELADLRGLEKERDRLRAEARNEQEHVEVMHEVISAQDVAIREREEAIGQLERKVGHLRLKWSKREKMVFTTAIGALLAIPMILFNLFNFALLLL